MNETTKITKVNWPASSDNAADYKYAVVVDGETRGTIWQDEFNGPWTTDRGGSFKTRKDAVAAVAVR